jgi:hypothetical protein
VGGERRLSKIDLFVVRPSPFSSPEQTVLDVVVLSSLNRPGNVRQVGNFLHPPGATNLCLRTDIDSVSPALHPKDTERSGASAEDIGGY